MKTDPPMMFGMSAGRPKARTSRRNGYYLCSHCREVLTPSPAQLEVAENAPDANPALKCSHCHKYAVHWVKPVATKSKTPFKPVSTEAGRIFFAGIFRMLAEI